MAEIINVSDQLGITLEFCGRSTSPSWYTVCISQQYKRANENRFEPFMEGIVDIYENDLSRLREKMYAFLKATDQSKNFKYVPVAEPGFELMFERIPHGEDYCRVVLAAIDLKAVVEVKTPIAYGENRVTTRFHTTEDRIQHFGGDLIRSIEKLTGYSSG